MDVASTAAGSMAFVGALALATMTTTALPPVQIPLNLTCFYTPPVAADAAANKNQMLFSRYVNGYLTGACVIGGTIGNVMSVRSVRLSNFERNRGIGLAVAIIVLAIWDTLMLWCAIAYYGLKNFMPTPANDWAILVTPFFHGFSQVTHTASVWSVVTITVQRYMATRDPFRNTRQHRTMFCSFRNESCAPPPPLASTVASQPLLGSANGKATASVGPGTSVKWRQSLLSGASSQVRHFAQTTTTAGGSSPPPRYGHRSMVGSPCGTVPSLPAALHAKYNGDWMAPSSLWRYLVRYRHHLRMPFIISVLAILVNLPAFFEITAVPCYHIPEYRIIYKLYVSQFRLNAYYQFWYRIIFRMLVTTCGPNIFILCLTVITVLLLRGTNRSRQRLFHNNEMAIEQYSSRAKMLTTISICLVVKFLLLRSLTFMLDIWEVAFGFKQAVHRYLYAVDISNFLIILNSSTNCLIIYGFSRWLHHKIAARNIEKREKQQCLNSINTKRRTTLLCDSWLKTLKLTHRQFGNRILYAMLAKNPQMFARYREPDASSRSSSVFHLNNNNNSNNNNNDEHDNNNSDDETIKNNSNGMYSRRSTNVSLVSNPPTVSTTTTTTIFTAPAVIKEPQASLTNPNLLHDLEIGQGLIETVESQSRTATGDSSAGDGESARILPSITLTTTTTVADSLEAVTGPKPAALGVEATAVALSILPPKKKKRSIDLLMNARFYKFGDEILHFFDDLIQMLQHGSYELALVEKIQNVGAIHYNHGVVFTASAWKEFKMTALSIFADCEYDSEADRVETLEAWSSFLSIIIHNMKLGMWNGNRHSIYSPNSNLNNNNNNFMKATVPPNFNDSRYQHWLGAKNYSNANDNNNRSDTCLDDNNNTPSWKSHDAL